MKKHSGFTLIELLVVVAIVGALASLVLASYTRAQKQSRDVTRKSDLNQLRDAFEIFANANKGFYPSNTDEGGIDVLIICQELQEVGDNPEECPTDPRHGVDPDVFDYTYQSDGSGGEIESSVENPNATRYVMWSILEDSSLDFWVLCSNGQKGAVPRADFSAEGGQCPL